MAQHNERGFEFEEQVSSILQLRGYAIERDRTIDGTQIDLIARSQDPLNDLEYLVECCSSAEPVGIGLVKEKSGVLVNSYQRRRLLFVSHAGFTREARDFAKAKEVIQLTTLAELERTLLDLRPYTQWLVRQFELSEGMFSEGRLFKTYVPIRCKDLNEKESGLEKAVEVWMRDDSTSLLFLLGEYGRGKTSFCRKFAYDLCKRLQTGDADNAIPIPVLINLRDYRRSQNIEQIVTDTLLNRYGVRIASFGHFQRFCAVGRVMLLLDGFDEMADSSYSSHIRECFQQVYALSALGTKTIVTCRTNFFKSHQEVVSLLDSFSIRLADLLSMPELNGTFSFKGLAKVVEVCPLNDDEVFSYLQQRFGDEASKILEQLKVIHDLSDLSRRPVLLDMICDTLPHLISMGATANSATLYEFYTKRWTRRDGWRTTVPADVRQDFCESLAWLAHLAKMETLEHRLIRDAVTLGFTTAIESPSQVEVFLNDIQTCSFLVRSGAETTLRFAHKSFQEFFVARRLIREFMGHRCPSRDDVEKFMTKRTQRETEIKQKAEEAAKQAREKTERKESARRASAKKTTAPTSADSKKLFMTLLLGGGGTGEISHLDIDSIVRSFNIIVAGDSGGRRISFRDEDTGALEATLLQKLQALFGLQTVDAFLNELQITPEIATFAVETLVSSQIDVIEFLSGLTEEDERAAFLSLLHSGPIQQFFDAYVDKLLAFISDHDSWWIERLSHLIARFGPLLSNEQVTNISKRLEDDALPRFQLGLIQSKHDYRATFDVCFDREDIPAVQRVLVRYGRIHQKAEAARDLLTEDLVVELIMEHQPQHTSFLEDVLRFAAISGNRISKTILGEIRASTESARKLSLISCLEVIATEGSLGAMRALYAAEKDPKVRSRLKIAEKGVLDKHSRDMDKKMRTLRSKS